MTLKDLLNTGDHFAANNGVQLVQVSPGTAVATMDVTELRMQNTRKAPTETVSA